MENFVPNNLTKAIEVVDLTKHYGDVKAVDGISFYIKKGQVFTLLGPNGAGKTTTVEILEGLKEADSGEIFFLGKCCKKIGREEKEKIGVLLQETNFIERVKVKEMVSLFASFYRKSLPVTEILETVALTEKADAYVETLSGGQRQRLAIGLALVNDPEIVFLDEPTTGLDPQARRNIWELIERLKDEGKTIFLTTHYMEEAERLSDYVYIMDRGKIIAHGTPRTLINNTGKENVLEFSRGNLSDEQLEELKKYSFRIAINRNQISVYASELTKSLSGLLEWARSNSFELKDFAIRRPNLEDVFLTLTGKGLRD